MTHLGKECFMNCRDLRGVTFRGESKLQYVEDRAFSGCYNLYAFCSGGEVVRIGEGAFENCRSLRCAYFGGNVEKIGRNAFASCGNLALVSASDRVTELKRATFNGCRSLASLPLSPLLEKIDDDCFGYCAALENVDIPDEHKGKPVIGIAAGVFRDRKKMYYISLPGGKSRARIGTVSGRISVAL